MARNAHITGKVSPDTKAALQTVAQNQNKPIAELVNEIVIAYLSKQQAA